MALTRLRFTHLLADFHSIQPGRSDWQDAQRLITRWGKWGRWDGSCTADACAYGIVVGDPYSRWMSKLPERWREHIFNSHLPAIAARLGWRDTFFQVEFAVQKSKIISTKTFLALEVYDSGPPNHWEYLMGFKSQVRSRLTYSYRNAEHDEQWIMGPDEQLDDHPDYKIGRPDGCEGCAIVEFAYVPTLSQAEIVHFTSYNFSCLTRFHPCTEIGDLLPAGSNWHLYDENPSSLKVSGGPEPIPCRTPARARGRDAGLILEVVPLSAESQLERDTVKLPLTIEKVRVRLLHVLKGSLEQAGGSNLVIIPFSGSPDSTPPELSEHLTPGHSAFVLIDFPDADAGQLNAQRCGVLDDTPSNLAALQAGMAQTQHSYTYPRSFNEWP